MNYKKDFSNDCERAQFYLKVKIYESSSWKELDRKKN